MQGEFGRSKQDAHMVYHMRTYGLLVVNWGYLSWNWNNSKHVGNSIVWQVHGNVSRLSGTICPIFTASGGKIDVGLFTSY